MKHYILTMVLLISHFGSIAKEKESKQKLGNNILSFHPLHLVADNHVGVGVSYERIINPYVGLKVPIMKSINSNYTNISIEAKLYPAKNIRSFAYAIAPSIMFGTGDQVWNDDTYYPGGYNTNTIKRPRTHFGFLLNQTLNFTIAKQMYIGLDGGIGINYFDDKYKDWSSNLKSKGVTFAAQFHMALGFRF